jgi:nucleoside-diphosphate-sugar epimerase
MTIGVIGHTGLVGGTLVRAVGPAACFNSTNIEDIRGRTFDLLICAGARAEKWRINQDPASDVADLTRLTGALAGVQARRVLLISTVDVYPVPIGVDEDTWIDFAALTPYGAHRLRLEHFVASRFDTSIVRLPGLFGMGLKKNVIFDLLHGNQLDRIHPDGTFQFYDLSRLWTDVQRMWAMGIRLLNIATEPVTVRRLAREAFGHDFSDSPPAAPPRYDFRSRHAGSLGGRDGYLYDAATVSNDLQQFVRTSRQAGV